MLKQQQRQQTMVIVIFVASLLQIKLERNLT